jgi:L-threonylcarbamoyladenylate synthase
MPFLYITSAIEKACSILYSGGVIAIPTETVYGLAADSTSDAAVARVYDLKRRPSFNPLIAHVSSLERAMQFAEFSQQAIDLAETFWRPDNALKHRPLTIIAKLKTEGVGSKISKLSTNGLHTIGIRVPNHPITNEILRNYANPLSAPSANLFQQVSSTNARMVLAAFGDKIPLVIDGGQCEIGLESTIIAASETVRILRVGGTPAEEIARVLGYQPPLFCGDEIIAPGMMKKHYATRLPLRTNMTEAPQDNRTAFLGFAECSHGTCNLSARGDLLEAAGNLFRMLSDLDDQAKYDEIHVAPIPMSGLGAAINDRLRRAAYSSKSPLFS